MATLAVLEMVKCFAKKQVTYAFQQGLLLWIKKGFLCPRDSIYSRGRGSIRKQQCYTNISGH